MKIAVCAANAVGYELLKFLVTQEHTLEYVVTAKKDPYEKSISRLCGEYAIPCYRGMDVNGTDFISLNKELGIDIVFLLWWPTIIRKASLASVNRGFINTHPGLLPYNRGMNPYYWSIVDGTPAGVTIHWIDEEINRGEILFQKRLEVPPSETGERLYQRAAKAMIELFRENYDKMLDPHVKSRKMHFVNNIVHRVRDMEEHSCIDLERQYKAGDLINILRARSFTNGPAACFHASGKKYHIRVSITEADRDKHHSPLWKSIAKKRADYADSET
ncbi:hypothetical protein EH220_00205 [bacterium]|nr:MAG: hypothetical protein EH220_00205 [bacterium]